MKTVVLILGYFCLCYMVIFVGWLFRHRLQHKLDSVVEVPEQDQPEPSDMAEVRETCPVTGSFHRWKCQGEDTRGTFYSQCEDCGIVSES